MSDKEKILAEIKRLKKDWQCYLRYSVESKYRTEAYTELLDFINSLPEEPVSEDLEEAIDTYLATYFGGEKEKQDWPFLKKMAIHFAKWGKNHAKVEIQAQSMALAHGCPKESITELEEAAKEHAVERFRTTRDEFLAEKCKWSFKAGAQWQKQQMMAKAVDGVVHHFEKCGVASVHYNDPTGVPMAYFTSPEGLSAGDKVKIITIKKK